MANWPARLPGATISESGEWWNAVRTEGGIGRFHLMRHNGRRDKPMFGTEGRGTKSGEDGWRYGRCRGHLRTALQGTVPAMGGRKGRRQLQPRQRKQAGLTWQWTIIHPFTACWSVYREAPDVRLQAGRTLCSISVDARNTFPVTLWGSWL